LLPAGRAKNQRTFKEQAMASDIILEDESIRMEGPMFDLHGHTLVLDAIAARDASLNTDDLRRPLVHDGGDTLTINWRGNYAGGVAVMGPVTMPGAVTMPGTVAMPGTVSVGRVSVDGKLSMRLFPDAPPHGTFAGTVHDEIGGRLDDAQPLDGSREMSLTARVDPFEHLRSTDPIIDLAKEIRIFRQLLLAIGDRLNALESPP
jgi:hypothetical protein